MNKKHMIICLLLGAAIGALEPARMFAKDKAKKEAYNFVSADYIFDTMEKEGHIRYVDDEYKKVGVAFIGGAATDAEAEYMFMIANGMTDGWFLNWRIADGLRIDMSELWSKGEFFELPKALDAVKANLKEKPAYDAEVKAKVKAMEEKGYYYEGALSYDEIKGIFDHYKGFVDNKDAKYYFIGAVLDYTLYMLAVYEVKTKKAAVYCERRSFE